MLGFKILFAMEDALLCAVSVLAELSAIVVCGFKILVAMEGALCADSVLAELSTLGPTSVGF